MPFTAEHIQKLKNEFDKINSIDPDAEAYKNLCKFLDQQPTEILIQLRDANIKFLSKMAMNRVIRRGIS